MEDNLRILEIVERMRKVSQLRNQANGAKETIQKIEALRQKNENGQNENFSSKCKLCDNTTWVEYLKDKRVCAYRCECYEKKNNDTSDSWIKAGLTLESSKLNFKSFETINVKILDMKDVAIKYFKNFEGIKDTRENSIIFSGNPGCGKTHLSVAIANNLIKKKKKVIYMPYRDAIINIKQNMLDAKTYKDTLDKFKKAEVLLIDDLFKGQTNKSDLNIMFEIINYRYMNNFPMIISTELTIEELIKIDEAVGSRIYEMVSNYTVEVLGNESNYRLRKRKKCI